MAMTEVDDFLEHHGVKGQKWGIRNKYGQPLITNRRKAVAKGVAVGVGIGAAATGAVYANHILKKNGFGSVKLSTINKASKNRLVLGSAAAAAGAAYTKRHMKAHGNTQYAQIGGKPKAEIGTLKRT